MEPFQTARYGNVRIYKKFAKVFKKKVPLYDILGATNNI